MVAPAEPQSPSTPAAKSSPAGKGTVAATWLIPGETSWEVWQEGASRRTVADDAPAPRVDAVALPASLVTSQLFWLETADEKAIPDLVRMQCERRSLLRQDEVWKHRVIRREGERALVQVLILQNTIPPFLLVEGVAKFEAHPRCLALPPRALCVCRSLGAISLTITGDDGVVYFQSLPHQALDRACARDIQSAQWLATAQNWAPEATSALLVGNWDAESAATLEKTLGLPVQRASQVPLALPAASMELVPRSVRELRLTRRRQHRIKIVAVTLAALYALFFLFHVIASFRIAANTRTLQARLNAIMPRVLEMQATARELDALNPVLDPKTYPLEILHRVMALLPEKGVRLTRFEITAGKIEIGGESSTAREAFDYIRNLETSKDLQHIKWDEAPQPIPLPNDTTRFSISGDVEGAYHDPEES